MRLLLIFLFSTLIFFGIAQEENGLLKIKDKQLSSTDYEGKETIGSVFSREYQLYYKTFPVARQDSMRNVGKEENIRIGHNVHGRKSSNITNF